MAQLLTALEYKNPEYIEVEQQYEDIETLVAGGYELKEHIEKYLPRRQGEEASVYNTRLDKFTYTPVLANAISKLVSRVMSSHIDISSTNKSYWDYFRENTNADKGRSEKELLSEVFSILLKYGSVFLHVDSPSLPVKPLNKAQEKLLQIEPYINVYSPCHVIDWSDTYVKVRNHECVKPNAFTPAVEVVTWTVYTAASTQVYSAIVKCGRKGIQEIYRDGEYVPVNNNTLIELTAEYSNELQILPVIRVCLEDEMWVGNQALSKAIQHLRTECHKYDIETLSYVQRQWNPVDKPEAPIYSVTATVEPPSTGMQYVAQGNFEWKEAEGKILPQLASSLESIKEEIENIIAGKIRGVTVASGISKVIDLVEEFDRNKQYGHLLVQAYQKVLALVSLYKGFTEAPAISGLSDFSVNNTETFLSKLEVVSSLDVDKLERFIGKDKMLIIKDKISDLLIGNDSNIKGVK